MGSSPCLSQLSAATMEVALAHLEGPIVSTPSRNDSLSNFKTCAREPNGNDEKAHASWIGPPYGRGGAQPLELQLDLELERKLKLIAYHLSSLEMEPLEMELDLKRNEAAAPGAEAGAEAETEAAAGSGAGSGGH